jgi:hypothetical protein
MGLHIVDWSPMLSISLPCGDPIANRLLQTSARQYGQCVFRVEIDHLRKTGSGAKTVPRIEIAYGAPRRIGGGARVKGNHIPSALSCALGQRRRIFANRKVVAANSWAPRICPDFSDSDISRSRGRISLFCPSAFRSARRSSRTSGPQRRRRDANKPGQPLRQPLSGRLSGYSGPLGADALAVHVLPVVCTVPATHQD